LEIKEHKGGKMRTNKSCLLALLTLGILLFTSCAGIPLFSGAKQEFEQGLAKFNAGKYEEAIPFFDKAIELDPEYVDAYLYLARSNLNLRRWSEAVSPLRTAYRLSPAETRKKALNLLMDALMGAAGHEFAKGNFKGSIDYIKELLQFAPDSEKAKTELLKSLMAFGKKSITDGNFEDAVSAFKEVLTLSPNDFDAYLGMARAFFKSGNYSKAIQALKKAIGIHPTSKEALSLMRELIMK
jgi:tetratricopeptide (TPR) repeat protein